MIDPTLHLPDGAVEIPDSEGTGYGLGPVRLEVRQHQGAAASLDVVLTNTGGTETTTAGLLLDWDPDCPVAWLSGSVGFVVAPGGTAVWRMLSGWCSDARNPVSGPAARLFGETVRLAPGQRVWSRWRREPVERGAVPLPAWVPERRHLPEGQEIEVRDLDVALSGTDLTFRTTDEASLVQGRVGLHQLAVHGPNGVAEVEVGWYHPMQWIVPSALDRCFDRDVEAWLLAWLLSQPGLGNDDAQLDRLDVALGASLEEPTLFGVLAALRAASSTELPLGDDPLQAATRFLADHPGSDDGAVVAIAALLSGGVDLAAELCREPGGPAWSLLAADGDGGVAELLATLEFGLPSSAPPTYTARDVTLARLWLASRPESPHHVELAAVADAAASRLKCALSRRADPLAVAWLLVGESFR